MPPQVHEGWKDQFLAAMRGCPNILRACEQIGVSRKHVHNERKRDSQFDEAVREAIRSSIDLIEQKAFDVATGGDGGKPNPNMIQFLLKAHKGRYQDKSTVKHEGEQTVKVQVYMPDNSRDVKQITDETSTIEVIEGEVIKQTTE